MDPRQELELLIRAKYPIISINSWEERRVEEALSSVCGTLKRKLHVWTVTQGMKPPVGGKDSKLLPELEALVQVSEAAEFTVFLLKDFHPYLRDPRVVRLLRDLASSLRGKSTTLILLSPNLQLPTELEKDVSILDFGLPGREEIEKVLDRTIDFIKNNTQINSELAEENRDRIVQNAQGMTLDEIESVLALGIVANRAIDVDAVLVEKQQIIRKSGLLEYIAPEEALANVGGMNLLKEWLERRTNCFSDEARKFGIPVPRGILLLGVQGCGKSLAAKAVASEWRLPMLRLDVGRIFGSLVGKSEENIRRAIQVAESVAPCILWADELEKGFAGVTGGGAGDSGTSSRVFATFLTWMQEKTAPVFLIATANDVSALPPEMLRKGRFDEIFFVDLPSAAEREHIIVIHLKKRNRDPGKFNIRQLADASKGFSGAEIEQAIIASLYTAFADNRREITDADIEAEMKATVPLSVMMREEIDELRTWAQLRTRPAAKAPEPPATA
ncbi:MAG: AAA family ATPase [Armatimonadetes bacterium]|nr:AAA family ATPase [Armatimonadota bacterium]